MEAWKKRNDIGEIRKERMKMMKHKWRNGNVRKERRKRKEGTLMKKLKWRNTNELMKIEKFRDRIKMLV